MNPTNIKLRNILRTNKKTDVNNLLVAHYKIEWKNEPGLFFYKFVLERDAKSYNIVEEDTLCEHVKEEINIAV